MSQIVTINPNTVEIVIEERVTVNQYLGGAPAGAQIHYGQGEPNPASGNTRDSYIDTITGRMYKKESAAWVYKYTLTGSVEP